MYDFFLQNWPEGTDPHKFVYEDIAIATYLLVSLYHYIDFPYSKQIFALTLLYVHHAIISAGSLGGRKKGAWFDTEAVFH